MEFQSYTMSSNLFYHRITLAHGIHMNRMSHISQRFPWLHFHQSHLNGFFCHLYQTFLIRTHFPDTKHSGCIRKITVVDGRHIHIDNISFFQNLLLIGNTMADDIISGRTHALRKALIIQRRRNCSHSYSFLINPAIDLFCGNACLNMCLHIIQHCRVDLSTFTDSLDLFYALHEHISYFHNFLPSSHDSASPFFAASLSTFLAKAGPMVCS